MTMRTALLLLALAAAAAAAPYEDATPRCSTECPVAAAKFSFTTGKTYSYTYSGKSKIRLKGVEGGLVETRWEKQVLLTWLTPCDVAISFKDSKLDGEAVPQGANMLEKYPLVVAMTDGRVQRVCSHPDDDTWAINMKKGIASSLQISVTSLSNTNSGFNITETDVVGTCPTRYEVRVEGERAEVKKEKNHRLCHERYPTPDETHLPWLKGPLPIEESRSACKHEINSGIISSVKCEDKNVVRPSYGMYKFVEAEQESTLRLVSSDAPAPDTISRISNVQLVPRRLLYDYENPKKEPALVPQLEQTLRYLCQITKDGVEADAAFHLDKAVHLMRRIPDRGFKDIYAKVRGKQICPEHNKLESLYFDAIAFVHEPESVEVMVKELLERRATGARAALYTAAFSLVPRPNLEAIQALEPLFRAEEAHMSSAKLAAATLVNRYCRHKPHCYEEAPVRNLPQTLKHNIEEDLSPSSNEESQEKALCAFKSLGNMGVMTPEVSEAVLRYVRNENKKVNIRVAATQSFRLAKCERPVTQQLVDCAVRPGKNTEVRIACYLAAVRCANYEHLQQVVANISSEENTQVRGFIMSHLINLQRSDNPEKEKLRYLLTNAVIPQDFEANLRKYSRNIDLSYFSSSLGLGAGVESNLIYAPGSFIPRSLDLNFTAAVDGTGDPMSIGEIGARFEGLEPFIAQLFGPASYFKKSSYTKIFHDLVSFVKKNWNKIKEELEVSIRERRSVDYAAFETAFKKLYGAQSIPVQADIFARFRGQEITYASLSKGLHNFNVEAFIEDMIRYVTQTLANMKNMNLDSARAAQLYMDYSFPTIHGIPLKMTTDVTAVAGMKIKTNFRGMFSGQNAACEIKPTLSVKALGFVGYDAYIYKNGIKMNTTVSSSNGVAIKVSGQRGRELQVDVDIPNKMEIINIRGETFLMKRKKDQPTNKILPPSMQDIRFRHKSCFTGLEPTFAIKMCSDVNVPDIFRANSLPLGSPAYVTVSLNKTEHSIRGYKIAVATNTDTNDKKYACKVSVEGSASPKEADVEIHLKKDSGSYLAAVKLKSTASSGEAKAVIINRPEFKSFQTDVAFKANDIDFSRLIKVDLKISPEGEGKKYEVNVFSSASGHISAESNIFTAELVKSFRAPWLTMDASVKTKNALMPFIPFTLEVGGDFKYYSGIPLPMRLRKLELETDIGSSKVTAFFRKSGESGQSGEYSSAFQLAREGRELIHLRADLRIQGTPAVDFTTQILTKAKFGESEYKLQQTIEYQEARTAFNLQLTRPRDNVKLVEIIAEKDSQEIKFLFQIQEPEYMLPMKVAARASHQGEGYMAEAAVIHGGRTLLQLQGPVTFINSPRLTKLETDIKINNFYQLTSHFEFEEGKQTLSLEMKGQQKVLASIAFNLKTLVSQKPSMQARVYLPVLSDAKTEVSINEDVVHASTNILLLPRSSSPRRVKAFMDVNLDNKQGHVMVLWDADRDPSKKIAVDAIIAPESGSAAKATVHMKIMLMEETYNANMKVEAPCLVRQYHERNAVRLEVETPARTNWMLEVGIQCHRDYTGSADFTFKSVNNNKYRLESDFRWQRLDGPYCYEADSTVRYTSPQNGNAHVSVRAKHHINSQRRLMHLEMEASTPNMEGPLKVEFSTENNEYSYVTKLESEGSGKNAMFNWHLETFPDGGVKTLDISCDIKAIKDVLNAMSTMVGSRDSTALITAFADERSNYRWRYHRPDSDTHSVKIDSPYRTLEAEGTYSPSKAGFKIYPNRAEGEHKYEVAAEFRKNQWGGRSTYEGRVSHPLLARDMTAVVEYTADAYAQQGSFELDVFPDTEDKITGSLRSVLRANNTVVIEANLSTRVLRVKPKVTVEASWAAHTAAFNFTFKESPSSPESFKVNAKYDRISKHFAAMSFLLATEGRRQVDVSCVAEPRENPDCAGLDIKCNVHSSVLGDFIVNSTFCKPSFLELVITKPRADKIYKARCGVQSPYRAEISLSKTDRFQIWEKDLSIISIMLTSPRRVKIDFEYKPDETRELKDSVMDETHRVTEAVLSWTDFVYRAVKRQAEQTGVPFPNPEIRKLFEAAKHDAMKIYEDVIYRDLRHTWEAVMEIVRRPPVTFIREIYYQTLSDMAHMQMEWAQHAYEKIRAYINYCSNTINEIIEAMGQAARWVETGEKSEMMSRLLEELRRTVVFQMLEFDVIDPIRETYPDQYREMTEVAAKVTDTLRKDLRCMRHKVWASPTLNNVILKIIDFSQEETMKWGLEWWLSQTAQRMFIVAPEPGTYRVGFQIPLYRPVYSLMQIVNMTLLSPPSFTQKILLSAEELSPIPFSKMLETYYAWMPANLSDAIPPFNRSAFVVADEEILTFDGALLRMPRSRCNVLLSSVPGVASVHMSHPEPSAPPQITFNAGNTKATIKPSMEVDVNGQPVQGDRTVGDMRVRVTSHYVTLVSPMMGVHLMKEERVLMLNVSGWAFNYTKGLLGSYDNERGNDRIMSNGRNATNLHDLVASWQDDPRCTTPSISPIDPEQVPFKESVVCDLMFHLMKPCRPVVSPKPFLQRCRAEARPQEAASSYEAFCRMHGVMFPTSLF